MFIFNVSVGADFPALNVRRHFFENIDCGLYSVVWETVKTRPKTMERLTESTVSCTSTRNVSSSLRCFLCSETSTAAVLKKSDAWWTRTFSVQEVSVLADVFSCFSSHLVTSSKSRGWFPKHSQLKVLPCLPSLQKTSSCFWSQLNTEFCFYGCCPVVEKVFYFQ